MLKSDSILKTNEKSGSMRFPSLPLSLVCVSCLVVSDSATPWTVAHQAPLSMGFSRQEYWSGLPFPSPGDLLDPGTEPGSPTLQADSLPSEPAGKLTKVKVKVVQSCPTLCDPMDLVHGVLQARILEWEAFPFFRGLPNPGLLQCRQSLYQLSREGSLLSYTDKFIHRESLPLLSPLPFTSQMQSDSSPSSADIAADKEAKDEILNLEAFFFF